MKQRIVSIIKCCTILLSLAIFMTGCTQDIQIPSVDPSSESESVYMPLALSKVHGRLEQACRSF